MNGCNGVFISYLLLQLLLAEIVAKKCATAADEKRVEKEGRSFRYIAESVTDF